ncbi:MAG: peptidylprolyl isomerase [Alphaproteobacteria bacterium PA2]|nr:MAG: peptidylprolyl isomerase [Alphaproteobacteria bacterium PA2]
MARIPLFAALTAALLAASAAGAAPARSSGWTPVDPENLLVIDTTKGRILVAMAPDLAPRAVERIRLLAREHVYDGLQFHRVIEGFVDQTGNPNNRDGGVSSHPDLAPEFIARLAPGSFSPVRSATDSQQGFVGPVPVEAVSLAEASRSAEGKVRLWGAYCPGVAGMGRQADPGSANSEIFFMRESSRRLDRDYTVWGKVVLGLEVVRAMAVGEPPTAPDKMLKVTVASDLAPGERPRVEVMDARSAAFRKLASRARQARGADFTVCDLDLPARLIP